MARARRCGAARSIRGRLEESNGPRPEMRNSRRHVEWPTASGKPVEDSGTRLVASGDGPIGNHFTRRVERHRLRADEPAGLRRMPGQTFARQLLQ
jgi:hypothetical protein